MLLNFKKKIGISNQFDDFKLAMEILPSAVMVCEVNNFTIVYANPKSIELLETIKHEITIDRLRLLAVRSIFSIRMSIISVRCFLI